MSVYISSYRHVPSRASWIGCGCGCGVPKLTNLVCKGIPILPNSIVLHILCCALYSYIRSRYTTHSCFFRGGIFPLQQQERKSSKRSRRPPKWMWLQGPHVCVWGKTTCERTYIKVADKHSAYFSLCGEFFQRRGRKKDNGSFFSVCLWRLIVRWWWQKHKVAKLGQSYRYKMLSRLWNFCISPLWQEIDSPALISSWFVWR